jgi:hypothetical protein
VPTLDIPFESERHAKLLARVSQRMKLSRQKQSIMWDRWRKAENKMVAWLHESTFDAKRRLHRDNAGQPEYTTIQIPYTYALVMTAHTYWTSVFFGRNPVHQFAGRNGTGEMQVQAMESLIQYQVDAGRFLAPYYLWFYDAAKYGQGVVGEWWCDTQIQYGSLEAGEDGKPQQVSRRIAGYQGNCIYNISPYNFFPDPRVTVGNFQRGEFLGVETPMAWHEILKGFQRGDYMNMEALQQYVAAYRGYGDQENYASQVIRPDDQWLTDAQDPFQKHPSRVRLLEFHIECSPQEWDLGDASGTEKWVITLTADEKIIIGCRPLGMMHGEFPFGVIEPEVEAYGMWGRGIPEIADPIQRTMDWLINSHFYNVRASLNNQFLIDPSRVLVKDAEKGGPGFIFRLRPEGYGQDLRTMMAQFPVTDVTKAHMSDLESMFQMSERVMGINEQMFGVMQEGGRKTATEIRTSTGFGTNRQKTQTEWISTAGFMPHAERLIKNTQQYYDQVRKMRIVGDAASYAGPQFLTVDPESIGGEFDIVPVDGTLPIDRYAQVTMWKDLLSTLMATPIGQTVIQQMDVPKLISWIFSLGGLKNVKQFQVQVMPPGAQPGPGMVPIGTGGPGPPQALGGPNPAAGGAMGVPAQGGAVVPFSPNVRVPRLGIGGGGGSALPTQAVLAPPGSVGNA